MKFSSEKLFLNFAARANLLQQRNTAKTFVSGFFSTTFIRLNQGHYYIEARRRSQKNDCCSLLGEAYAIAEIGWTKKEPAFAGSIISMFQIIYIFYIAGLAGVELVFISLTQTYFPSLF